MSIRNLSSSGTWLALFAITALGSGCASDEERWESADFGDSVREMIVLQTEYAGAAGTGMDGRKADAVLRAYREDVAAPERAERDITFQVVE